jgi:hypothetical protein
MGKTYAEIDDALATWLRAQPVFFVATAPLAASGHVNVSPKGLDTFAVLGPSEVAYLDLTGSGVETISHLRENRRITILFCAFAGPPKIVRLYGQGEALEPGDEGFDALVARFPRYEGTRAVVRVRLTRIADSCGYAVPRMRLEGDRDQLLLWTERKGPDGVVEYREKNNARSIDGLPGLRGPR